MFEQLYTPEWLISKPYYGYLLGLVFAIFGIFSSKVIFGSNPGLMSVAFTSILLIPTLHRLISITESREVREDKFNIFNLLREHLDIMKLFMYIFLGIMTSYAFFTIVWTNAFSLKVFAPQLNAAGITGAAYLKGRFLYILSNNIKVLLVCFLLSFFYGAGSIIFIAWNASVWGAVFGFFARQSSSLAHQNPFLGFMTLMIPIFPHMLTEAISYFSATMVGGIISKAVIKEKWMSKRFKHVMSDSLIFLILALILIIFAAYLEVYIFPKLRNIGSTILALGIIVFFIVGMILLKITQKRRLSK